MSDLSITEITEAWRQLKASEREGWRYADELEQQRKRLQETNQILVDALLAMFASIHPYRDDGTPTIPDETVAKANAAIAKATGENK